MARTRKRSTNRPVAADATSPLLSDAVAATAAPDVAPSDAGPVGRPSHIVGIGASAGGLEALERFFDHMPPDSGMAFVVVLHLSPDFKSLMGELLSKRTRMSVRQVVSDRTVIQPDSIYVIPPRKNMVLERGQLVLTDIAAQHGLNLPIDIFFRSLAEEIGDRAIGIILSGTGSDGTRGVRAIKEAGGIVVVQDDRSAKFDGMPRSAIATGVADYVLPPEEMPRQLLNYTQHPLRTEPDSRPPLVSAKDDLHEIFVLLRNRMGLDFSQYKPAMIARRIERRIIIHQLDDLGRYRELLASDPEELHKLSQELLIHVTAFFRDSEAFTRLGTHVVARLLEQAAPTDTLRVWVPACATGEEAYSLGILFLEEMQRTGKRPEVKIFATDVDEKPLEQAGRGVYAAGIATDLTRERLDRFFVKYGDTYQVSPQLRKLVIFAPHNVAKDPPFTKLDLVSCRNLLIYLQPELQKKVLTSFQFALNPRGYMFLGSSETIGELADDFDAVDTKWRIYQKCRPTRALLENRLPVFPLTRTGGAAGELSAALHGAPVETVLHRAYETLVADYAPPCLLINDKHELLYVFGDASAYLRIPAGRPNQDVLRMVGEDLAVVLATAMHKASASGNEVVYQNVRVRLGDVVQRLALRVRCLPGKRQDDKTFDRLLLVMLDARPPREAPADAEFLDAEGIANQRLCDIEHELRQTRESLQATIEELETSNEELQATNEELLAANEELQSTNEELQSVNEELFTVNVEYQKKIAELTELNNDIDNLFRITDIGTIIVDRDLRVRKFTPAVVESVNLVEHDVGRPLDHISHNLSGCDLAQDARAVLASGEPIQRELTTRSGGWTLMRVLPYKVATRSGEGLIITFVNISALKASAAALAESEARFRDFYDHAPDLFATLEAETGRIVDCNRTLAQALGWEREQLLGQTVLELYPPEAAAAAQRALDEFARTGALRNVEQQLQRRDGSRFDAVLSATAVRDEQGRIQQARAVWRDVSELKAATDRIRSYTQALEESQREIERQSASLRAQSAELERRNAELARSNKELDDFAHCASHDLQEPLQSLKIYCRFLEEDFGEVLGEDGRSRLAALFRQAEQMENLVDSLLQYSRIARLELNFEDVDLDGALTDVLDSLRPQLDATGTVIRRPTPLPTLRCDPVVAGVFRNLVTNALKYNDKSERWIEVGWQPAAPSGETASALTPEFYVRDNGIGIRSQDQSRVFEIFRRLHPDDRYGGGTGAGLTIARKIVERHGGRMRLESKPGEGTTVAFTLSAAAG